MPDRDVLNGAGEEAPIIEELAEALSFFHGFGCPVCGGDCSAANPPMTSCPMLAAHKALSRYDALRHAASLPEDKANG